MRLSLFLSGLVAASSAVGVYAQIPDADLVDQSPAGPLHHNDKRLCLLGLCVGGSIDLNTDVNNCGSTGFKCPTSWANGSGAKCSGGRCMPGTCALGYTLNTATASCVNTANDIANCGTCGNICSLPGANGHTCSAGVCQATSCISGYGLYSGSCKNLATDPANCGTLGNVCQFPGGTGTCSAGKCTLTGCGSGYYAVGGKCVQLNLQTDPLNCGSIGKVCTVANGIAGCSGGACTIASCSPGYQLTTQGSLLGLFGSSSSCTPIDTSSSLQNCGSIGHACAFTNGVGVCQGGTCTYTSCTTSGFYLVGNQCVSLNLATDTKNCGSIGSVCSVPNGVAKCVSGNCQIASCNSGYALTTSGSLLGLFGTSSSCQSVNLASDPSNCGSVGNVCPSTYLNGGPGTCVNGKCATTCGSGFDFDLFYNFCRPVSTDTANCGACGVKCNIANAATQICSNSKCVVTACAPGYTLSNNACVAANYQTDVKNCGSAGHACVFSPSGASGTCQSGVCVTTSCPFGYQLNNGACVLGASAKARAKRSKVSTPKTLCPAGEQACPIAGSTLFVDASAQHFKSGEELTGLMARSGGYECLDTTQSLESCGGCASTGEGQDCTAIPHARGVGCEAGQCRIFSCSSGYKLNLNGDKCIRSRAAGSTQRNNTASHARHISSRRSAHGHSHGRALAAPLSS